MKAKLSFLILGFIAILLTTGMNGGCGEKRYSVTFYYYPDWTPDGKIICSRKVETYKEGGGMWPALGGGATLVSTNYYIATMSEEGTQETDIKEISRIAKVVASPLGNYIAYTDGNYLRMITSSGTDIKSINTSEDMSSFDWSPDETRVVYTGKDSNNLYIISISDEVRTTIATNAAEVAWRIGEKIAYGFLYAIDSDGENNSYLVDGGKPQIMNSGKILYYADLVSLGKYKIKSIFPTGTDEALVMGIYDKSTLRLSFDNTKVVGGVLDGDHVKGIWTINVVGSEFKQLR